MVGGPHRPPEGDRHASIAKTADVELLYDRPYEDRSRVRVAGPFTVESLSPHRVVPGDEEELIDLAEGGEGARRRFIEHETDGRIKVCVKGVNVYDPNTGEIRSNDTKGIAAWFIDTAYNEESFFARHAYFLGANDPYKSLKTALQADIDREAWETLYRAESRPFAKPATGKIAVKVINHFGDEVLKVFRV